jgi:hypothetical protein
LRRSQTSFFEAVRVLPESNQVLISDLLEPERPEILLTDFGLSATLPWNQLPIALFCRIVPVQDVNMTSGFTCNFGAEFIPGLLQAHRQKMKKVAAEDLAEQRFIFFFQKHREVGHHQIYQDVV